MGVVIGIDPGMNGGIALITCDGEIHAFAMPTIKVGSKSEVDVRRVANVISNAQVMNGPILLAAVERVSARPGQGVCSMFSFGVGYGAVRAVLEVLNVPYEMPTPQAWQKVIFAGMPPAKDTKTLSVAYCTRRFPTLSLRATDRSRKAHDGISDAACLAEYARRLAAGVPTK